MDTTEDLLVDLPDYKADQEEENNSIHRLDIDSLKKLTDSTMSASDKAVLISLKVDSKKFVNENIPVEIELKQKYHLITQNWLRNSLLAKNYLQFHDTLTNLIIDFVPRG